MILQANLNFFNTLVIRKSIQTLNNRLVDRYGTIKTIQKVKSFFLIGNEDFIDINSQSNSYFFVTFLIFRHVRQGLIDITMRARMLFKIHCMGLNFKSRFCTSIKRENKEFKGTIKKEPGARIKQIPPISGIKLKDYFLFDLASFSRQVAITQAEKLVFSFLACSSICSIKSWGKRIFLSLELLLLRPVAIFKPLNLCYLYLHYTINNIDKKGLTCKYTLNYIVGTPINLVGFKNNDSSKYWHTTSYLTQPLTEVMIMANRYDSAPLRAEQSKLFKFYDLSTTKVLETVATTERQARQKLGKQSLIFIARIRLYPIIEHTRNLGGYLYE